MKTFLVFAVALLLPTVAMSQDQSDWSNWTMGTRYAVQLGLFHPYLDTNLQVDASDGSDGKLIDFEQNLGMNDTETLPSLTFDWRFARKHRMSLGYYRLDRSGSAITTSNIQVGDQEFVANLPISSFLDISALSVSYTYSLLFSEKGEIAIGAGLTVMDIQIGLFGTGSAGMIDIESGLTAPLPTVGLRGAYAFTDKLYVEANAGFFSFDLAISDETDLRGDIAAGAAGIYHNTFEHARFGLVYYYYDVEVSWGNAAGFNSLRYQYHGPALSFAVTF